MSIFSGLKQRIFRLKLKSASPHERAEMMRNKFFHLGKNVELYTVSLGTDPYLISIDDDVVCAAGVVFLTHDVSCYRMADYLGIDHNLVDKVGSITLHKNCFVGAYTLLMPGCSVGKNSVVAAGSVVTKHIPDGEVWGGVPAKFIMSTDEYAKKIVENSKKYPWLNKNLPMKELIEARQAYFFKDK